MDIGLLGEGSQERNMSVWRLQMLLKNELVGISLRQKALCASSR